MIISLFNSAGCAGIGWILFAQGHPKWGAVGYFASGLVFGLGYATWCMQRVYEGRK